MKAGERYVFHPRGADRLDPDANLKDGDVVTIYNPFPYSRRDRRLVKMDHVHVLKGDQYAGFVWVGSLDPLAVTP